MAETDTPLIAQYQGIKAQHANEVLFFRLGDFYEMFGDDAVEVSRLLNLTLTHRADKPMCGIPYHAAKVYIARLLRLGKKIAICEQVEDPKLAKGLVKREVVRIATPGTNLDTSSLDAGKNNYLLCIVYLSDKFGIAAADITTGVFFVTEADSRRRLRDEIVRYLPVSDHVRRACMADSEAVDPDLS